ncbi:hypothetical protein M9Y10_043349 [Tritrichomonas musculus]|uniref:Ubiquitin-like domain-containing protein n=1 Tax=Tritrichomonas musculus TaxID=1915356 RepID=A0ABR2K0K1_9EUKA
MEVYVKNVREKNAITVLLQPESTVLDLKNVLGEKYGVPTSKIKLIFNSILLKDDTQPVIEIDFEENLPINFYVQAPSKKDQPQTQSQVQPQIQPQVQPQIQPQVQPQIQPQVQPQIQPQVQPQIQPQVQPQIQPQVQPQIQPQVQPQIQITGSVSPSQPIITISQPQTQLSPNQWEIDYINQLVKANYGPNYKAEITGKQGNRWIVKVTSNDIGTINSPQEIENMKESLMQIYNEMDAEDQNKVNMLKDIGVDFYDAIYAYTCNGNDYERAKVHCIHVKQTIDAYKAYGFDMA